MLVTDQLALGRLDGRMTATGQGRQCRSGDPHNRRTQLADDFVPPRESADWPITEIGRLIRLLVGADLSRTLTRGDDDAVTDQCQSNTAVTFADDTRAIAQGRKCDTTKSHKHIPLRRTRCYCSAGPKQKKNDPSIPFSQIRYKRSHSNHGQNSIRRKPDPSERDK